MKKSDVNSNQFVMREQDRLGRMYPSKPAYDSKCYEYNAHMTNTGERAVEMAGKLTAGIDEAFPVK